MEQVSAVKGREARRKRMEVRRLRATRSIGPRTITFSCYPSTVNMVAADCFRKRPAEEGRVRLDIRPIRLKKEEEKEEEESPVHHICSRTNRITVPCLCAKLCGRSVPTLNHKDEDTPKSVVADAYDDGLIDDERQKMFEKLFGRDEYSNRSDHNDEATSGEDTGVSAVKSVLSAKNIKREGSEEGHHGWVEVCGRRREMEDAVMVAPGWYMGSGERFDFYGVYDGHGGAQAAQVCKEMLHRVLLEEVERSEPRELWRGHEEGWGRVMRVCFARVDAEVERIMKLSGAAEGGSGEGTAGSTAVVALVSQHQIIVANCGDLRAVLARAGTVVPLSFDHKPDRPDAMERVESAGGRIINWDGYRVLGVLATSRSIGGRYLKSFVISEPEVTISNRTPEDEFLVLASDGLWDVMSNELVCRIIRKCLSSSAMKRVEPEDPSAATTKAAVAATVLTELALNRGSDDNISVVIVDLRQLHKQPRVYL